MSSRDFTIEGGGTLFLLIPHTQIAKDWVAEKIAADAQRFGGGIAVEHRYILDIAEAIRKEGFTVNT